MKAGTTVVRVAVVFVAAMEICLAARTAGAQTPCSSAVSAADSAREELVAVMSSESPLVSELRTEQKLAPSETGDNAVLVTDPVVCNRIVIALTHPVVPGTSITVLKMGSLYFARDPDQKQSTGVITDSTYKVLLRLGRAIDDKP